jgi:MFS family permease
MGSGLYPERRNSAVSVLVSFYTIGAVASNLLVLLLVSLGSSWRIGYLAASAMALPWGVLLLASGADPREAALPAVERAVTAGASRAVALFVVLCVAQLTASAAEVSTSLWIPTFLIREAGASSALGPLSLLLFCVMGAVGKLGNSVLISRVDGRSLVAGGLTLFVGGLLLAVLSAGPMAALAGFCLVGLGTGGFVPTVTVRLAERFPNASASRYSLFMAVGNMGPVIGPILIGLAADGNLRLGMLTMLPAAAVSSALLLALPHLRRQTGAAARSA